MSRNFPIHPLLVSVFPVFSLYAANATALPAFDLVRPMTTTLGVAALLWALIHLLVRDGRRSALMTTTMLVAFWTCTGFAQLMKASLPIGLAPQARYFVALWLGVALVLIWRIWVGNRDSARPTYIVNIMSIVLIALPAGEVTALKLAAFGNPSSLSLGTTMGHGSVAQGPEARIRPDIYYIVLDAFGRSDVLDDNGFALEEDLGKTLKEIGFFVGSRSNANYPKTMFSLPSSLNMQYIHTLVEKVPEVRKTPDFLAELIRENAVIRFLRALEYEYVACSSGFHLTENLGEDVNVGPAGEMTNFEIALLGRTPIFKIGERVGGLFVSPYAQHRRRIGACVDALPKIAENPAATFTFAHIIAPHHPFVFDAKGASVDDESHPFDFRHEWWSERWPTSEGVLNMRYAQGYGQQATYISKIIRDAVVQIIERSPAPPIIVIQGDHGPNGFLDPQPPEIQYPILNAYYLPEGGSRLLYPSITPVNSFRMILSEYFGADLELLPDERYRITPPGFTITRLD